MSKGAGVDTRQNYHWTRHLSAFFLCLVLSGLPCPVAVHVAAQPSKELSSQVCPLTDKVTQVIDNLTKGPPPPRLIDRMTVDAALDRMCERVCILSPT